MFASIIFDVVSFPRKGFVIIDEEGNAIADASCDRLDGVEGAGDGVSDERAGSPRDSLGALKGIDREALSWQFY